MQIRIFDDRIEVWGCGPLPEPLTPDDLKKKHKSILRNSLIGKYETKNNFNWNIATNERYMKNVGIGATFEKNVRLVELENGNKVWLAEIVDNDFEEKVADWIFDENGNTLLCYPDPKEFDRILIEIDRKHGLDEFGEPIKKSNEKGNCIINK